MGWVIFAAIMLLIGIISFFAAAAAKKAGSQEGRRGALVVGFGATASALIIPLVGSFTTVGTNTVGVVTEFGRYQGTVQFGCLTLTAVRPIPTSPLTDIPVRFEDNSGGDADVLVEWRVESTDDRSIQRLWNDYRTLEAVQDRVVQANSRGAINVVLSGYTPSEGVSGASIEPITDATLAEIRSRLPNTGMAVERVTVRQINPDAQSQDRINRPDRPGPIWEQETEKVT